MHEIMKDREVAGRAVFFDRFGSAETWSARNAEQDFQIILLCLHNEMIEFSPAIQPARVFDRVPVDLLFDPTNTKVRGLLNTLIALWSDKLSLHADIGFGHGRWSRRRCDRGCRS